jgi:hypothetical protein
MTSLKSFLRKWLGLDALEARIAALEAHAVTADAPNPFLARMAALESRLAEVEQRRPALVSIGSSELAKRVDELEKRPAVIERQVEQPSGAHSHAVNRPHIPGAH